MTIKHDLKIWLYIAAIGAAVYLLNMLVPIGQGALWSQVKGLDVSEDVNADVEIIHEPTITPTLIPTITPTPVLPTPTPSPLKPPITVQLVGDSMMLEGFGPRLDAKLLAYNGVTVKRFGKYSTGLNRVDYYDWYAQTEKLLITNKPDVLIVMFGANDGQGIVDLVNGKRSAQSSSLWDVVYTQRVNKYLTRFAPQVKEFYWIGQPIARTDEFYNKFSRMNKIYAAECAKFTNCHFVDGWARFAVNGRYSATLADDNGLVKTVKGGDGVHLTTHGGNILADLVIKVMKQDIVLIL